MIALRTRAWAVIVLAAAAISCGGSREGVIEVRGQAPITVTEDELVRYVRWWRDYLTLQARHRHGLDGVATQRELLATLERQRRAMQEVMNQVPVDGWKMEALRDAVPGVATLETQGDRVVYVPGHDEIALAAARKKYGDKFVGWLISRESVIARALSD